MSSPVDGSGKKSQYARSWGGRWLWVEQATIDLECLARRGLDPLSIHVTDVLLEERRILEL